MIRLSLLVVALLTFGCEFHQDVDQVISTADLSAPVMGSVSVNRAHDTIIAIDQAEAQLETYKLDGSLRGQAQGYGLIATAASWHYQDRFYTLDRHGAIREWSSDLREQRLLFNIPDAPKNVSRTYCDFDVTLDGGFFITSQDTTAGGDVRGRVLYLDSADPVASLISTDDAGMDGDVPEFFFGGCPRVSVDPIKKRAYVLDHQDDIEELVRVVSYDASLEIQSQNVLPQVVGALDLAVVGGIATVTHQHQREVSHVELYNLEAIPDEQWLDSTLMATTAGAFVTAPIEGSGAPDFRVWFDSGYDDDRFAVASVELIRVED